jgi:hypothetical protein
MKVLPEQKFLQVATGSRCTMRRFLIRGPSSAARALLGQKHDPKTQLGRVSALLAQEGSTDGPAAKPRNVLVAGGGEEARARRAVLQAPRLSGYGTAAAGSHQRDSRRPTQDRRYGDANPSRLRRSGLRARSRDASWSRRPVPPCRWRVRSASPTRLQSIPPKGGCGSYSMPS